MNFCPLCNSEKTYLYINELETYNKSEYFKCVDCELIFIDRKFVIPLAEQKSRYLNHNNNSSDLKYREFHNQLFKPFVKFVNTHSSGLDYGSGSDSAIFAMFKELNFNIFRYDPLFFDDEKLLHQNYDYIVCTETAEHFIRPAADFKLLNQLLNKNGYIGFMTKIITLKKQLIDSGYIRDETHISFYSFFTFEKIAEICNWKILYCDNKNTIIFRKNI